MLHLEVRLSQTRVRKGTGCNSRYCHQKYLILTPFCPGRDNIWIYMHWAEAVFMVVLPCKVVIVTPWTALFSNVADICEIAAFKFFCKMQCFLSGGFGGSWCWRLSSVSKVLQSAPVKLRKCIKSTCTLRSWSGYCGTIQFGSLVAMFLQLNWLHFRFSLNLQTRD